MDLSLIVVQFYLLSYLPENLNLFSFFLVSWGDCFLDIGFSIDFILGCFIVLGVSSPSDKRKVEDIMQLLDVSHEYCIIFFPEMPFNSDEKSGKVGRTFPSFEGTVETL